jgi:hypothetical protein
MQRPAMIARNCREFPATLRQASRISALWDESDDRRPRHFWWHFVSSSKERIEQAKQDWKTGRFTVVQDKHEFIPLPE